MTMQVYAETSIKPKLQEFLRNEDIDLHIVSNSQCEIKIISREEHKESNLNTIYLDGWITCEMARSFAKKINIPLIQMGKLLNHLNVKIKSCSLGCFK